jgi:polysaccharide export outer membrane protein
VKPYLMRVLALVALSSLLAACAWTPQRYEEVNAESFKEKDRGDKISFAGPELLAEFESEPNPVYLLGEGDHLALSVWGRSEFDSKHVIGPDGRISLPLAGTLHMAQLSRDEAAASITRALTKYYAAPVVSLMVEQYVSNRITVLGRVQNPGVLNFDKVPTILEVLARAGALPVIDKQATLTRCAIFRGRDKVIWVNLQLLLSRSDPAYNIRLKPNDLVYIPDSNDTSVYVLGSVPRPGAYRLTPDMALLDALAQAGGPNEDASPQEVTLYRPSRKAVLRAPLASLMLADKNVNFALEEGDIVYVPKTSLAEAGYVMRQIMPGLSVLTFGINTAASLNTLKALNATK